uniref:Amiloride-sensitive sodium channel n=1 Tax=Trichobilharzia regenti TaxID=157069 RepID=A0AA85J7G9_TRIRE|nr:unnamed protein product [Trichobilharzia regenti]
MEQPRFLTGWTPFLKTFVNSNRAVKALWAIFAICMVIALVSSVTVVVLKYLNYVTVVRLDQRGPKDGVPPPAVTICLAEHQTKYLKLQYYRNNTQLNIIQGIRKSCNLKSKIMWDSSVDAISQFYNNTKHFQVILRTEPPGCYSVSVMEQVPWPPDSICTTFQLAQDLSFNSSFWKIFHIEVRLAGVNQTLLGRPLIIAHEPNSFPFDNFGRYLYEFINPGTLVNIFYSKSITKRLNTRKNPCTSKSINLLGNYFDYDQITCQWHTVCAKYNQKCDCTCPLELLRLRLNREMKSKTRNRSIPSNYIISNNQTNYNCPLKCPIDIPIAFVNNSVCPLACRTVTYKKLNEVLDNITDRSTIQLELIQAEGLTEMTEEALYSLPKLFSEIGGLSSFCFGFSCILFFELIELVFWLRCTFCSNFIERVKEILGQQIEITDDTNKFMKNNDNNTSKIFSTKKESQKHEDMIYNDNENSKINSNKSKQQRKRLFKASAFSSKCMSSNPFKVKSNKHSTTCNPTRLKHSTSHHIDLNPLNTHKVDGSRLSEYPKDQDSPLIGLKSIKHSLLDDSTLGKNLNSSSLTQYPMNSPTVSTSFPISTVPVILNNHLFQVVVDYEIS